MITRYLPNFNKGLTKEQVESRIKDNLVNYDTSVSTKSIKSIIIENIFTIFNLLNLVLALAVLFVGSYRNLLFMGIVICNTLISTYQEIHSKKVVDKLAVVSATKITVIREGKEENIEINELVLDDIVKLNSGNQIVTDSVIQVGEVEVNESFITGESNTIYKKAGDILLSGSFIVSGNCIAKVEHIGLDNYTSKIAIEAKKIKTVKSEIMIALNKVIKIVSILIIPVGILLFYNQILVMGASREQAVIRTVAALIGMIPEGLILLTSTVLAVSVIRLSKNKVLVQELYCIEALARVNTLCLDKTGTITEGKMKVADIIPYRITLEEMKNILGEIGLSSEDNNVTIQAIRKKYNAKEKWKATDKVPFSSQKKWSGITFENNGSYILGAPEFVLKEKFFEYEKQIKQYSKENRVLALVHSNENFNNKELPNNMQLYGFVLIQDIIRKEANKTIKYFEKQGVEIKIISGDNPVTVSTIAKRAGIEKFDNYIDMTTIGTQEEIREVADTYTIFGRVSPIQKRDLIKALKELGHTVAMTGDGVNDVLALKEADCSIAIASGSDAARNVSQLVLLDSNFSSMPKIVAEGRRTINNIERSAQLFLVKTIYSTILAILFLFINMPYPFKPIQLSMLSIATIGIPSFVLALQPNKERVKGNFLKNVLSKSVPTSLTVVCNIILTIVCAKVFNLNDETYSTMCVLLTSATAFTLLLKLCRPFNPLRVLLWSTMVTLFFIEVTFFREWFYISTLNIKEFTAFVALASISLGIYLVLNYFMKKLE